jgi:pimeloyl-ACP methyl ester carboxylesterase
MALRTLLHAYPTEHLIELPSGLHLSFVTQGDPGAVPVVFLHGWSDSRRSFDPLLPHLPPSVYAIAVSQRGHGDSSRPATGYNPGDMASDVIALLDAMAIGRAVIVGHSMGTTVAQRLAMDQPERVGGLVLLGAIRTFRRITDVEGLLAAVNGLTDPVDPVFVREFQESTIARPVDPAYVDLVVDESLKLPARVWQAIGEEFLADEACANIDRITAPTLLIWGDQDSVTPRNEQDDLLDAIPGAELIVYAGTGHAVHWEQPERVAADLMAFVDTVMTRQ